MSERAATTDEPTHEGQPLCFKCERNIRCTIKTDDIDDYWHFPRGVSMDGGGNYGSALYDSFFDGVAIQLLVCDDCLIAHPKLYREIKVKPGLEKMEEAGIIKKVPPIDRIKRLERKKNKELEKDGLDEEGQSS